MSTNAPLTLINFSHPLTSEQISQVEILIGQKIDRILNLTVQFDVGQPFLPQLQALLGSLELTAEEWQSLPILINPPALNVITALLLAELHGRMGYFPAILRLRPVKGSLPPRFEAAEILDLQSVRETARQKRKS
jgi:hypothetical protein